MSTRAEATRAAVNESRHGSVRKIRKMRGGGSPRGGWEDELSRFYNGDFDGGLRSRFGAALERAQFGISGSIGAGGGASLPAGMAQGQQIEAAIARATAKWAKVARVLPARFIQRPKHASLDKPGKENGAARPLPPGVIESLPGLGEYAGAALLTDAAIEAARGLMTERRAADAARARGAVVAALEEGGATERLMGLRAREAQLVEQRERYADAIARARARASEAAQAETTAKAELARSGMNEVDAREAAEVDARAAEAQRAKAEALVETKIRKEAEVIGRIAKVRADLHRMSTGHSDIEELDTRRWDRDPTVEEVLEALERAHDAARAEDGDAHRLLATVKVEAKRDVDKAVALFGAEREVGTPRAAKRTLMPSVGTPYNVPPPSVRLGAANMALLRDVVAKAEAKAKLLATADALG